MYTELIIIFVLANYISLVIELVLIPVPSIASTYQLMNFQNQAKDQENNNILYQIRTWSKTKQILFLFFPAGINILIYLIPFIHILMPITKQYFLPFSLNPIFWLPVGLLAILAGRYITIKSAVQIRKNNSQQANDFFLHADNLYGKSRNPGLLGMYINVAGLWCLFPSFLFLAGILFYLAYMHFKVRIEEAFLLEKFGEKYEVYFKNTPRYIKL